MKICERLLLNNVEPKYFICLFEERVHINVSQHLQENTCSRVSFLIIVVASLKFKPIFIQKRFCHWCFPVSYLKFLIATFFEKHCYKKKSIVTRNVYQISIANLITQLFILTLFILSLNLCQQSSC